MNRRFAFALTAGVLSTGGPTGLLGMRLARNHGRSLRETHGETDAERAAYFYVGGATAIVFATFGYLLGRQADKLALLSETDSLTGLLNARGFAARLRHEIKRSRRYQEPLALLFIDLDGLKQVNDRHGHRAGSDAIRQVGTIIRAELRDSDVGARWGGDEFTVVVPNTSSTAAESLANRIRSRVEAHADPWPMTVSIGVASFSANGEDAPAESARLLRAADAAMYAAKRRGKNTVVVSPERSVADLVPV
jgi:diguanylate cyclase (GGDEF)-like protein